MASQQLLQFARSRAAPWVAADAVEALARSCSESRVRALVKEGRESGTFTCVGFRKHNEMLFAPLAAASTVACAAPSPAARAPEAAADEEPVDTTFACDSLLALCGGEERRHALAAARAKTPCEPPPPGTGAAGLVLRVAGYCSGGGSCEQAALDAGHTVGSVCELDGRSRRALAESPVVLAGGAVLQSDLRDPEDRRGSEGATAVMACAPCDGFSSIGVSDGFQHELSALMDLLLKELEPESVKVWVTEHVTELCSLLKGNPPGMAYVTARLEAMVRPPAFSQACAARAAASASNTPAFTAACAVNWAVTWA